MVEVLRLCIKGSELQSVVFHLCVLFGMALLTLGYTGGRHEGMIKKARRSSLERGTAVYLRMCN